MFIFYYFTILVFTDFNNRYEYTGYIWLTYSLLCNYGRISYEFDVDFALCSDKPNYCTYAWATPSLEPATPLVSKRLMQGSVRWRTVSTWPFYSFSGILIIVWLSCHEDKMWLVLTLAYECVSNCSLARRRRINADYRLYRYRSPGCGSW